MSFMLSVLRAQSDSLRISWDLNPESDMLEYRLLRAVNGPQNFQLLQTIPHPITQTVDRSNIQLGNLYSFTLVAVDSAGNPSENSDTVSVGLPVINWTVSQIVTGGNTTIPLSNFVADPDNSVSELVISISNQNNVTVSRNGNDLIITPVPLNFTGSAGFTLRLEDPAGFWDREVVLLNVVVQINLPPQITSTPVTLDTVGNVYQYQVTATDPNAGDTLLFSLIQSPPFLGIDSISGLISGTPVPADTGSHPISVRVHDQAAAADTQNYVLQIIKLPEPPVISNIPNQTIAEGDTFAVIILDNYVTDPDDPDEDLVWTYSGNSQLSITINANRRATISTPNPDWNGNETVTFRVTDPTGLFDTDNATFTVTPVNDPPQITSTPVTQDTVGNLYQYQVTATDPDLNDTLTYSLIQSPAFLAINNMTGLISGTPSPSDTGNHPISVQVQDQTGAFDTQIYALQIIKLPEPPVISDIPNQTIAEGDSFAQITLDAYVSDPDDPDEDLVWTYSGNSQLSITIDVNRRATIAVPHPDWNGNETVTFRVTDPTGLFDTDEATFTVTPVNDPPQITSAPLTGATQGSPYSYDVTAVDPDSLDVLTFSLLVAPAFLNIDDQTGLISGTPAVTDTGNHNISVKVQDQVAAADTQNYTLTVFFSNLPPVVSNIPDQTIAEGGLFSSISLDNFVADPESPDEDIIWSYSGNSDLTVQIDQNRIATVLTPHSDWFGNEEVTFTALDPGGLTDRDTVSFTVTPVNDPPVLQLSQIIINQPQQNIIDLKQYVADIDDSVLTLSWQFQNYLHFQLTWEDQTNQLLRIDRLDNTDSETGTFIVIDPGGLSDTAQVTIIYQGTGSNTPPSLAQLPELFLMEEDISYIISMEPYVQDSTHNIYELTFEFFPGTNLQTQYSWVTSELTLETSTDWFGTTDLRVVVSDPGGMSDEKWVTINTHPRVDLKDISFQFENENSVSVDLETDIPSEVDLSFWVTPTLKSTYKSGLFTMNHSFSLSNLLVDTTYQYTLTLTDTSGFQKIYSDSSFHTGAQQEIIADNAEVFVYPNPYRPSKGHSVVVFENLPVEMTGLMIYTPDGRVVYERKTEGVPLQRMPWSVINRNGEHLASGLYIYIVKGENGKKIKSGKLAVIR
jgi:hypothetical protein